LTAPDDYIKTHNSLCRIAASIAIKEWIIMNINGEVVISAPRSQVWQALNDPVILARCIEGCESLERIKDQHLTGRVTTKIGPVKASFSGDVTITNIVPDVSYTISGEGKGGVAGFAKGGADVQLEDQNDGKSTRLTYTARASVGGKLAQLGSRLIEATAKAQAPELSGGLPAWVWIGLLLVGGIALLVAQLS
jgi:uncharacterized protein